MAKTPDEEKNTIDLVTGAMFSISFLDTITNALFNHEANTQSLIDFYNYWLKGTGAKDQKIPFSPGSFVGYLFCGLLITKENWSDLLPDQAISTLDPDWGLSGVSGLPEDKADPKLSYVIRRVRNALGHTNFTMHVPTPEEVNGDLSKIHTLTKFTFRDVDPKHPNNWFEVMLTMHQLELLIKKFQSIVHQNVRLK
ncbi:HEPN family nuclease [Terrimonas alba]|uniref:HEPN family nuclease n=1 Tax=Terrimonas alba TaxID=3349636 RepID=UPI0035F43530